MRYSADYGSTATNRLKRLSLVGFLSAYSFEVHVMGTVNVQQSIEDELWRFNSSVFVPADVCQVACWDEAESGDFKPLQMLGLVQRLRDAHFSLPIHSEFIALCFPVGGRAAG